MTDRLASIFSQSAAIGQTPAACPVNLSAWQSLEPGGPVVPSSERSHWQTKGDWQVDPVAAPPQSFDGSPITNSSRSMALGFLKGLEVSV